MGGKLPGHAAGPENHSEKEINSWKGMDMQVRRYMPWAAGSRNCVGMPQAQVTMQATLATLLSRFSFRLAERVRPSDQGLALLF